MVEFSDGSFLGLAWTFLGPFRALVGKSIDRKPCPRSVGKKKSIDIFPGVLYMCHSLSVGIFLFCLFFLLLNFCIPFFVAKDAPAGLSCEIYSARSGCSLFSYVQQALRAEVPFSRTFLSFPENAEAAGKTLVGGLA